jgi:parallel beta-helix repeat protein
MDHPAIQELANRRALLAGIGGVAAGAFLGAGRAEASPLNPPGPPAPTMKPLDEVEPRIPVGPDTTPGSGDDVFVIDQPGSYYLTSNIEVPSGGRGIVIQSAGVHLDLMGFAIRGLPGSLAGIRTLIPSGPPGRGVVIANGTIENLGLNGVFLTYPFSRVSRLVVRGCGGGAAPFDSYGVQMSTDSVVEDCIISGNFNVALSLGPNSLVARCQVNGNSIGIAATNYLVVQDTIVTNNGGVGVHVSLGFCHIDRVHAFQNGNTGIWAGGPSVISRCVANNNLGHGIRADSRSEVIACQAASNSESGIQGVGQDNIVADCSAASNGKIGFHLGIGAMVRRCEASQNGEQGILMGPAGSAAQCNVRSNSGTGIQTGDNCQVLENTIASGTDTGIFAGNGCTLSGNTISDNNGRGITLASSCTITDNTVTRNRGGGIRVVNDNTVKGNQVINNRNAENVGFGIRAEGAGNRIEANHMILNAPGLEVTSGANLIINNSTRANNPNYSVVGGNTFGPVVTSGTIGTSSNPHANYEF